MEFLRFNLRKLVIAKMIGIPLLITDYAFDVFSQMPLNTTTKIFFLVFGTYLIGCTIDHLMKKLSGLK